MRQALDQRRDPRHLLRARLSRPQRLARSLSKSGRNSNPRSRVGEDSAASVGAVEGIGGASTAAGSTTNETLIAGRARGGMAAAEESITPQKTAATTQARHDPTQEQRGAPGAPTARRGPAPAAGHRRYSPR